MVMSMKKEGAPGRGRGDHAQEGQNGMCSTTARETSGSWTSATDTFLTPEMTTSSHSWEFTSMTAPECPDCHKVHGPEIIHHKLHTCGHATVGTFGDGSPWCGCLRDGGGHPLSKNQPKLEGRTALCAYGGKKVPSSLRLAFFRHQPDQPHDQYYCGCHGWD
jgi:hypothetical protein